jgi:hypothetical protein
MKTKHLKRKPKRDRQNDARRDLRYASARPWDWRLCLDCDKLVSERSIASWRLTEDSRGAPQGN